MLCKYVRINLILRKFHYSIYGIMISNNELHLYKKTSTTTKKII